MRTTCLSLCMAALLASACGGGGSPLPTGPTPVSANVEFTLTSKTMDTTTSIDCAGLVRLHPSWWGYAQVTMVATATDRFGLLFDQVPIGRQSVRLTVPDGCDATDLVANGVSLESTDAGAFVFTVHSDGSVTP